MSQFIFFNICKFKNDINLKAKVNKLNLLKQEANNEYLYYASYCIIIIHMYLYLSGIIKLKMVKLCYFCFRSCFNYLKKCVSSLRTRNLFVKLCISITWRAITLFLLLICRFVIHLLLTIQILVTFL